MVSCVFRGLCIRRLETRIYPFIEDALAGFYGHRCQQLGLDSKVGCNRLNTLASWSLSRNKRERLLKV